MNFFKQTDNLSCGVCAINSILKMYNKPGIVFSVPKGTTPQQISKALKQAGILTKTVRKVSVTDLTPKSIIYYPDEDHYVTVEQVSGSRALVNDSTKKGPEWVDTKTLVKKAEEEKEDEENEEIGWVMKTQLKI